MEVASYLFMSAISAGTFALGNSFSYRLIFSPALPAIPMARLHDRRIATGALAVVGLHARCSLDDFLLSAQCAWPQFRHRPSIQLAPGRRLGDGFLRLGQKHVDSE